MANFNRNGSSRGRFREGRSDRFDRRSERSHFSRSDENFNNDFDNSRGRSRNREFKELCDAICDQCGRKCQVPFRPVRDKPVYCSECFGSDHKSKAEPQRQNYSEDKFDKINEKLNKIMAALNIK